MTRLASFLEVLSLLSIVSVILGWFGRWHFLPDLACHFRIQATGTLLVTGILLWPLKRRRSSIVSLLFGLTLATLLLPFVWRNRDQGSVAYRLLTLNVKTDNCRRDTVIDFILRQDPDFVLLQETDRSWIEALDREIGTNWPFSKTVPREDNFGIALYSKIPWSKCEVLTFSERLPTPSIAAFFDRSIGGPLRIIATHALPPMDDAYWCSRNELFGNLAANVRSANQDRTIVAGDLNCTPWSPHFRDFVNSSHLINTALGHGLGISWVPIPITPLGLPIDHVLVGSGIEVVRREVGPDVGSDHRAVIVGFR